MKVVLIVHGFHDDNTYPLGDPAPDSQPMLAIKVEDDNGQQFGDILTDATVMNQLDMLIVRPKNQDAIVFDLDLRSLEEGTSPEPR